MESMSVDDVSAILRESGIPDRYCEVFEGMFGVREGN